MLDVPLEIRALRKLAAAQDVRVVVVVLPDVEDGGAPRLVSRVHDVSRIVGHVAVPRVVRCAPRDEAHRVEHLVQDREVHDLESRARERRLVTRESPGERGAQVDGGHGSGKRRRPRAASAGRGRRAVVVHGVDPVRSVESGRTELLLDRVAEEDTARCEGRVRPCEPMERHVELASRGVDPQPSTERLAHEPALPVRDRGGDGAVGVERAVGAVGREDVHGVDLRPAHVVGPICRRTRERVRSSSHGGHGEEEDDDRARSRGSRGHSHSIVAGGFEEMS